jgi:hypothetical protein
MIPKATQCGYGIYDSREVLRLLHGLILMLIDLLLVKEKWMIGTIMHGQQLWAYNL